MKVKLLKMSKKWQQGIKPRCKTFLSMGLCVNYEIAHSWSWLWRTFLFTLEHLLSVRCVWKGKWMRQKDSMLSFQSLRICLGHCCVHVSNRRTTCFAPNMMPKVVREYLALLGHELSSKWQSLETNREKCKICTAET